MNLPVARRTQSNRKSLPSLASIAGVVSLVGVLWTLVGCGAVPLAPPSAAVPHASYAITGKVHGGQQPVTGAQMFLYTVGLTQDGSAATNILTTPVTTSDGSGNATDGNGNAGNNFNSLPAGAFTITGDYDSCNGNGNSNEYVYLIALGGNPGVPGPANNSALSMMASLGECGALTPSTNVVINEETTVGSLASLFTFMSSYSSLGYNAAVAGNDASQFATAIANVNIYTNIASGTVPGSVPSGYYASSLEIASLADVLAPCVNSASPSSSACQSLFQYTTVGSGPAPTNTIDAALSILKNPLNNACSIYFLAPPASPFQPQLSVCPSTSGWFLPIAPTIATPVISPNGGTFTSNQAVTITDTTPGATIYYTIDGTKPTTLSPTCSGTPCVTLSASATVQAIAAAPNYGGGGYTAGSIASAAFTIGVAGSATQLVFTTPPTTTPENSAMTPPPAVALEDAFGNIVNSSAPVTLSLVGGGNLGSVNALAGTATFNGISIATPGTYMLQASASGLPTVTSPSFIITLPILTFELVNGSNNLIALSPGLSSTLMGYICLGHPQTNPTTPPTLTTSNMANVSISMTPTFMPASPPCFLFSYTGGTSPGASTLTASLPGYVSATQQITATNAVVSLGTLPQVAPGQTSQIALSLGTPAPASPTNSPLPVTLTSSSLSFATVTPESDIYPGLQVPATNPQITGVCIGTTTLSATAPNYAADVRTITVTLTASMPATLTIPEGNTNIVLTLSAPAPAGGLTFAMTGYGSVTGPSSVTVAAGATTVNIPVNGASYGTSTLTATYTSTCSSTPTTVTAMSVVTVAGGFGLNGSLTTGVNLYGNIELSTTVTPTTATTITVTSASPGVALLSSNASALGTTSVVLGQTVSQLIYPNYTGGYLNFDIQGISLGTSALTISAPGFVTSNLTITVNPSGFILVVNNASSLPITTTTLSSPSPFTVAAAILTPTLAVQTSCFFFDSCGLLPGINVNVPLMSDTPGVGTVPPNVAFGPQAFQETSSFTPMGPGSTKIYIPSQPAGFTATSDGTQLTGTATVTQPTTSMSSATTGQYLTQINYGANLQTSAPPGTTVTVSVSAGSGVLLTRDPTVVGTNVLTYPNFSGTGTGDFWIQGQNIGQGSTTLTIPITVTANGYSSSSGTITVLPSGFVMVGQNFPVTTTTFSSPTPIQVQAAALNSDLSVNSFPNYGINAGAGPINVPIGPTTPTSGTVGYIVSSPLVFNTGDTGHTTSFQPVNPGTIAFGLGTQPTGFYATTSTFNPNNYYAVYGLSSTATVTAPSLSINGTTTGVGLSMTLPLSLPQNPPSPVTVTITASNCNALLSASATTLGTCMGGMSQVVFTNINSTNVPSIYVQGEVAGTTTTLTMTAPGYNSAMSTVTTDASGFVFPAGADPNLNTTTFSGASSNTIFVTAAILDPSTHNIISSCGGGYGAGCFISPYPTPACSGGVTLCPPTGPYMVPVLSSNTGVGTITTSPVVFNVGDTTNTTSFQPLTAGTTTLSIGTQPAGFFATPSNYYLTGSATVTAPQISISGGATGVGMYIGIGGSMEDTPPSPVTVTVTSSNPAAVLLSTDPTMVGTASLSFTQSGYGLPTIYCQGQSLSGAASATSSITVTAAGYTTGTSTITLNPSGFILTNANGFSTTTTSAATQVMVEAVQLNPTILTIITGAFGFATGNLNPGTGDISVPVSVVNSSVSGVGSVTGSAVFAPGSSYATVNFNPDGVAGTLDLAILAQPPGFTATTSTLSPDYLQEPVTVTGPPQTVINVSGGSTGPGLYIEGAASLSNAPSSPASVTYTVTSSNPSAILVTADPTQVGTASYTYTGIYPPSIYYQGVSLGGQPYATSTITVTATPSANYLAGSATVTLDPAGFVFTASPLNATTTTLSSPSSIALNATLLVPTYLTVISGGSSLYINPGSGPITVNLIDGGTGSISNAVFAVDTNSANATYTPPSSATTDTLTIAQPSAFFAPGITNQINYTQGMVTVSSASAIANGVTTGYGLAVAGSASVSPAAPAGTTASICVTNGTGTGGGSAVLSLNITGPYNTCITGVTVTGTQLPTFYIEGVTAGSATYTVTPTNGITPATANITVDDTGFVISSGLPLSTTTISAPSTITVVPTLLTPGTLALPNIGIFGPTCPAYGCYLVAAQSIAIANLPTSVGSLSASTVSFAAGSQSATVAFTPLSTGGATSATTTISLGTQPTGFVATSSTNGTTYLSGVATVSEPAITVASTVTTGAYVEVPLSFNLALVPASITSCLGVTVTSSNTSLVTVSTGATTAGAASASYCLTSTAQQTVYVQGVATGTAILSFTSSGYAPSTVTVTIDPAGFIISSPASVAVNITGIQQVSLSPAVLTPGTLTFVSTAQIAPGQAALTVTVDTETNSSCGAANYPGMFQPATGPLVNHIGLTFNGGDAVQSATFVGQNSCSSTIVLDGNVFLEGLPYPTGYYYPAQDYQIPVTVN